MKRVKPSKSLVRYLYYVEEYSLRQIGSLFGVSQETIRNWLKAKQRKKSA
ncbi:MAG: hypothetical protein J7L39_00470 [Candidatus Aenigmarchaeota archaeon]|nr:hypothetical protein [Candidatus Aenigmarchaeota archaeon]